MSSNDSGGVDKADVAADGAALLGQASAALEDIIDAESAMTVMLTSLGAGLQGRFGAGITTVSAISAIRASADAPLPLWNATTIHQEASAQIKKSAAAAHAPQSIVRQAPKTTEWDRNRMPDDSDLVEFLPEIALRQKKVGLGSLLESPALHPNARNQSAVMSSLPLATNSADDPKIVPLVNGGENQPIFPSFVKAPLITSDAEGRMRTSALPLSRNLSVTRTGPVAQLPSPSSNTTELAEHLDDQAFGMMEAKSPTTTAPLHEDIPAMRGRRANHDEKTVWPDARSVELRHAHTPEVTSEPKIGIVAVDGEYLGRWIFDRLSRQASRPSGGTTGIDPRISATHPGAAVGV